MYKQKHRDMNTRDWIQEQVNKLSEDKYAEFWNRYCEANGYTEDMLHPMGDFNEMFKDCTPLELVDIGKSPNFGTVNDCWFTAKNNYYWEVHSDDDPRFLTGDSEDELLDWAEENVDDIDFLDDEEYQQMLEDTWDEEFWRGFKEWFDETYGGKMCGYDIEVLVDEYGNTK